MVQWHREDARIAPPREREGPLRPRARGGSGSTDRQVRAMINHLRKDHRLPICSTPAEGFYWPRSRAHAMHTLAQLESRRKELEAVMEGILEGLDREFGPQLVMEMEAG